MRVANALLSKGRRMQMEPVPYKPVMPIALKPIVTGKGSKSSDVSCLFEMSLLFACMKSNEFAEPPCAKEISEFQKCYEKSLEETRIRKRSILSGDIIPGQKKMEFRQINQMLKYYPPQNKHKSKV